VGDKVQVLAGDTVPVDGKILTGTASVSEAMLTGEAVPRTKGKDELVFAGTQNFDASFTFVATKVGEDTQYSHIKTLDLKIGEFTDKKTVNLDFYRRNVALSTSS